MGRGTKKHPRINCHWCERQLIITRDFNPAPDAAPVIQPESSPAAPVLRSEPEQDNYMEMIAEGYNTLDKELPAETEVIMSSAPAIPDIELNEIPETLQKIMEKIDIKALLHPAKEDKPIIKKRLKKHCEKCNMDNIKSAKYCSNCGNILESIA
jgi:hypothetical protein